LPQWLFVMAVADTVSVPASTMPPPLPDAPFAPPPPPPPLPPPAPAASPLMVVVSMLAATAFAAA
jgi:hypothetical protein